MSLVINTDPVPLEIDADGVVRVGGTRVTLDTIVGTYLQGSTAEEIAEAFPTVALADIHAAISFYLRRRAEVDAYLEEGKRQAETIRQECQSRVDRQLLRQRLLARRAAKQ